MTKQQRTLYRAPDPDYAVAPGETLRDRLDELGMSQAELARRTGLTPKHVNQVLQGLASLSSDVAQRLEYATGTPARWWLRLEADYRAAQQRIAERDVVESEISWVKAMPVKQLVTAGALPHEPSSVTDRLDQLLRFFAVANVDSFRKMWAEPAAAFRQSSAYAVNDAAVSSWLRLGEIAAQKVQPEAAFDATGLRDLLSELRTLTRLPLRPAVESFTTKCRDVGLSIVLVPEISGARAYGATRWLGSRQRPLVQLSLRGKSDADLWDTCFHEIGHVLLHDRKSIFIESDEPPNTSGTDSRDSASDVAEQERQATAFADDLLIPPGYLERLAALESPESALDLAEELGIAASLVVSRLEREGMWGYRRGARLKTRFNPEDILNNPNPVPRARNWALPGADS